MGAFSSLIRAIVPDKTRTGLMDAVNEDVIYPMRGVQYPILSLSGTFANAGTTLLFEAQDGDGTWKRAQVFQFSNSPGVLRYITQIIGTDANNTAGYFKYLGTSGVQALKVRMSTRGGADSVTGTFYGGAAGVDVLYGAICGDIADGSAEATASVNSPPVKVGGRVIVGWPTAGANNSRKDAFFDYYGRQVGFIDQRVGSTIEKYMITLALSGAAGAGTNLGGLRKLSANPNARLTKITTKIFNAAAITNQGSPLSFVRATTVAGGTLMTAADIPKKSTGAGNATLEVRTGAVTGTEAAQPFWITHAASALTAALGTPVVDRWEAGLDFSERIVLTGDEGIIFNQLLAGDVDSRYYVTIEWEEDS